MPQHVSLFVQGAPAGNTQPVEVEPLGNEKFEVLYSPGFVEGIAAGDIIRVTDYVMGAFEVVWRGGNVAVKLASRTEISTYLQLTDSLLAPLHGRRDGALTKAAVWTIPVSAGFAAIESTMNRIEEVIPDSEWWYGNVYDENGDALNWWQ